MTNQEFQILLKEIKLAAYKDDMQNKRYSAIAAALNLRVREDNPVSQEQVPRRFTWEKFVGKLTAADRLVLYSYGDLARDLRTALEADDAPMRDAIWLGLATALSAASKTSVLAAFGEKQPDTEWQATILQPSRAQVLGLPVVVDGDVLRAAVVGS